MVSVCLGYQPQFIIQVSPSFVEIPEQVVWGVGCGKRLLAEGSNYEAKIVSPWIHACFRFHISGIRGKTTAELDIWKMEKQLFSSPFFMIFQLDNHDVSFNL